MTRCIAALLVLAGCAVDYLMASFLGVELCLAKNDASTTFWVLQAVAAVLILWMAYDKSRSLLWGILFFVGAAHSGDLLMMTGYEVPEHPLGFLGLIGYTSMSPFMSLWYWAYWLDASACRQDQGNEEPGQKEQAEKLLSDLEAPLLDNTEAESLQ